jgi:hypothetical protein
MNTIRGFLACQCRTEYVKGGLLVRQLLLLSDVQSFGEPRSIDFVSLVLCLGVRIAIMPQLCKKRRDDKGKETKALFQRIMKLYISEAKRA